MARCWKDCLILFGLLCTSLPLLRAEDESPWPEKGPRREGRTLVFPTRAIRWTLPEGSLLEWASPIEDESTTSGALVWAKADTEGAHAEAVLHFHPSPTPVMLREPVGTKLVKGASEDLARVDESRTKSLRNVAVGNAHWQGVKLWGFTEEKISVAVQRYITTHRGMVVSLRTWIVGGPAAEKLYQPSVDALLSTIELDLSAPWVVAPCVIQGAIPSNPRESDDLGKVVTVTLGGAEVEKPAELGSLPYDSGTAGSTVRAMWDAWTPDRTAYFCVVLSTRPLQEMPASKEEEKKIAADLMGTWKMNADSPVVVAKGKDWLTRGTLGRVKGLVYEFRAMQLGAPFVERGFLGRHGGSFYHVRMQFGGAGAEAKMAHLKEAVVKALKF